MKGFTLIELLIVIGICALLLIFSFSALANFRGSIYLEASARGMASDLRKTQSLAISQNQTLICGRFKFSGSGFSPPGGSGTEILESKFGKTKKIVVSSMGRVRIE